MFKKRLSLSVPALIVMAVLLIPLAFGARSASQATAAPVAAPAAVAPAAAPQGTGSLAALYKTVHGSVVEVVNLAQNNRYSSAPVEQGLGSGWIWDNNGHIVTNDHVVQGADALQIIFSDGTRADATLVGTDPSADIAVLKVDPSVAALRPLAQGNMANVEVGDDVVAIGNPYGWQGTLTVGIVSGLGRTISSQTQFSIPNAIQTDAAINPGNSGGPLLDLQGEVIGVNDQIESASGSNSGVGFAIPISIVQRVVPSIIKSGSYAHAYLGISGDTYNSTWASELGLPAKAKGVYVVEVAQGGPAANAGLHGGSQDSNIMLGASNGGASYLPSGGDLITGIDGQPVNSMDDLMTYLSEKASPGQTVKLSVTRGNQQGTIDITLGTQPATARIDQTSN